MKKVLMAIAAGALACACAFGFAACGNGGNGGEGSDFADGSVLTEEQWTKAFDDTFAARALSVEEFATVDSQTATGSYTIEHLLHVKYDLDANIAMCAEGATQYDADGNLQAKEYSAGYKTVSGTSVIFYGHSINKTIEEDIDQDQWVAERQGEIEEGQAEDSIKEYVNEVIPELTIFSKITATIDGKEVEKPVRDLFGAFTYDSATYAYKGEFGSSESGDTAQITVYFKEGKLSKVILAASGFGGVGSEEGNHTMNMTITFGYNPDIQVPQEGKDALDKASEE